MYHFNLEPLLNHRKYIEESKQKELSLVQRELTKELRCLADLMEEQMQLADEFNLKQNSNMQPHEFFMYRAYTSRLKDKIDLQHEIVQKAEKSVDAARNELLLAVKDRKTLETLKEKKKKEFQQKIAKKEQMLTNEAAVNRFNRKKSMI